MKIGDKEVKATPDARRRIVHVQVLVFGMSMASQGVSPDLARQLARELDAAADQAEGGAL